MQGPVKDKHYRNAEKAVTKDAAAQDAAERATAKLLVTIGAVLAIGLTVIGGGLWLLVWLLGKYGWKP